MGLNLQLSMWCGQKAKLRVRTFLESVRDVNGHSEKKAEKHASKKMKLLHSNDQ